jgi:DmsE family decaheme c-type cytochrome
MTVTRKMLGYLVIIALLLPACETLKIAKPILPIKEYERMLVGSMEADYVGTDKCLSACHAHDQIRSNFEASTMGVQLSEKTGLPLVNCESCHGPGSLAIVGITPEKVAQDAKAGKQTACNYKTFIDIKDLPAPAKSMICLKCHSSNATFNLHEWNVGAHAVNDVSCIDCHNIHAGPDLTVAPRDIADLCLKCHQQIGAEFSLPSHHPVPEKRVICTDCHQQHGTTNDHLLKKETVKEVCTQCHAEKEGPFLFEHAENTEECTRCHRPHGSVNNNLLVAQVPFLCLQCHQGHRLTSGDSIARTYTRCTDCHSQIHGTDIPSASGNGRFHM